MLLGGGLDVIRSGESSNYLKSYLECEENS